MAAIRIYRACPTAPHADRRPAGACRALCGVALLPRVRAIRSFDHVTPTRVKRESKSFRKSPHRQSVRTPAVAVCAVAGRIARTRHTWTCLRSVSQWRCAPCTLCCRLRLDVGRMRKIRVSFHGMACRVAIRHVRDQLCTSHKAPCTTPSTSPPPCHGSPRTSLSICAQCLCPIAHVPPTVRVIVPDAQAG